MLALKSYPTYTLFLAFAFAAVIVLIVMPFFIRLLKKDGIGQKVRADGPKTHLVKQGTPTMGGIVVLAAVLITTLLFASPTDDVVLVVGLLIVAGLLGLADDIESVSHNRSLGLSASQKMIVLTIVSVLFCLLAVNWAGVEPVILFPGGFRVDLGVLAFNIAGIQVPWLYIIFVFLLLAGLSNAVNLTDGLDGLSAGSIMVVMVFLAMVCFRFNEISLAIVAAAIAGSCVGFLWYNAHPAQVFMGDTGSLALGAAFAGFAVVTKTEVISLVMGGLFVIEALSVVVQVASFKLTGKRLFLMAPLHHHFEKLGWSETVVVLRFWIISAAFAALGFALYFTLG